MLKNQKILITALLAFVGLIAVLVFYVASGASEQAVRDDAMKVLMAEARVNGVVEHCQNKTGENPKLVEAARQWSEKNRPHLELAEDALIKAGNISDREKKIIERVTLAFMRRGVMRFADQAAYCNAFEKSLKNGDIDINISEETAPALQRLKDLPPHNG